ncbi:MAG: hypothetical protein O2807_13750, partial [bacterium]|nr:hypothetical protein [bacterium]
MDPRESIEWSVVGHDIPRLDGPEKVRGEIAYIGDMEFPGALHLVLARSDRPHAKILHIDTEAAAAAPGVIRVVTGEDIRRMKDVDPCFGPAFKDQPMLAIGKVRYAGEPIAAVAAESKEAAEAAAALIDAGYEDLPAVFGPLEAAREGAPLLHDALEPVGAFADLMSLQGKANSNICTHYKLRHGDAARALEEADQVFEDTF